MLGTSLLFWGAMVGWPWIGLGLALVVEARYWVNLRWDFDDDAVGRAWQFSVLAIVVAAVMIWLDGKRYTALPVLISWIPALLLPIQFVQSYGLRNALPLSEFSILAKYRRKRNQRLGLIEETTHFHFGNVLFVAALMGATVGEKSATRLFLPGLIVLIGWRFLSGGRKSVLAPLLIVTGMLALAGEAGLDKLSNWIGAGIARSANRFDPNFNSTMIGTKGTVRQSHDIAWRIRPADGSPVPPLLRINTFNTFLGSNWRNAHTSANDFKDPETRLIDDEICYILRSSGMAGKPWNPASFSLRGAVAEGSPLPLPGDVAELRKFDVDGVETNPFGLVRVTPKFAVISGDVFWRGGSNPDGPPIMGEDLRVPPSEQKTIRGIIAGLHLDQEPDIHGKLSIIRAWFLNDFTYTRKLTIRRPDRGSGDPTSIARFLTDVKEGHCEYFATATTLILREAGIPARYATGFAVIERDAKRGEFVIRGTHGHAWCRYWDAQAGLWMDFDTTPPDWSSRIAANPPVMQWFNDWLKRFREDFFLWRNQESSRIGFALAIMLIGIAAAAVIFRKLWRSKRRVSHTGKSLAARQCQPATRTPLHDLEKRAARILGPRPPGMPYARWLLPLHSLLQNPDLLDESIAIHQQLRFDPAPPSPARRERLASLARQLDSALKKSKRPGRRPSLL